MARWIDQVLNVNSESQICLFSNCVVIGRPVDEESWPNEATFEPKNRDDAFAMAIALRLAAKRLEEIGKAF